MLRNTLKLFAILAIFCTGQIAICQQLYDSLTFAEEQLDVKYQRSEYGRWIDADRDGQNTREEVLLEEAIAPGVWVDFFTGMLITNSSDLDIDHLVPLAEAHRSGAHAWPKSKKLAYANDLDNHGHLIAVFDRANQSKGSRDPAKWMPPNRAYWCQYLRDWVQVKINYSLTVDRAEHLALIKGFAVCESYFIRDSL